MLKVVLGCHRELTHYKGEPDPFKGDVPNQRVRDAAKEALDAIFAATELHPSTASAPLQACHPFLSTKRSDYDENDVRIGVSDVVFQLSDALAHLLFVLCFIWGDSCQNGLR
jgi:hypothetical protein